MVSPDHCRAVDVAAIELWRVGRFMIVPRWWWGRAGAAAWVVGLGCLGTPPGQGAGAYWAAVKHHRRPRLPIKPDHVGL